MEQADVAPAATSPRVPTEEPAWVPTEEAKPEAAGEPKPESAEEPKLESAEEPKPMDTAEAPALPEGATAEDAQMHDVKVEHVKGSGPEGSSQDTDSVGDKRSADEPDEDSSAKRAKLSKKAEGKLPAADQPIADAAAPVKIKREMDAAMAERALVSKEAALKDGQLSKTEDKNTKFTNTLTGITKITKKDGTIVEVYGILRTKTRSTGAHQGRPNNPYKHQRVAAKEAIQLDRILVCHDPGLGKTFTFWLTVAAGHVMDHGRQRKVLISVPASCLDQWLASALDSLRIPEKNIFKTNELKKLTARNIRMHDIIIVSRETLTGAFSSCYEWVTRHHQNERNNWVSAYDRIEGTPLHPIFDTTFDLFGIDEVHCDAHPVSNSPVPGTAFCAHCLLWAL